ncbi:MAG: MBL fold metallo-hydrolase [Pseudomonadota bacterium]
MIRAIVDCEFLLDGGAMNGIVPRALWKKHHPPDDEGRIELVCRCHVFEDKKDGRLWLVEAGMGDGWSEKERQIYGIRPVEGGVTIASGLKKIGYAADDVTDLVLTHLHFDHAAGAVTREDGRTRLTFPRAAIHVQRSQLDWALAPSARDADSFRPDDVKFLASSKNLALVDGAKKLSDTVSVDPFYGHTQGMQTVTIRCSGGTVVVAADLIPIFSHVRIPWVMAYDNHPLKTIEEKTRFLRQAEDLGWIIASVHDAKIPAATIPLTQVSLPIKSQGGT